MDFDKLSLVEKRHLSMDVYSAIKNQDMKKLKNLLPEAKDLLAFRSHFNMPGEFDFGSSVLHIAAGIKTDKYVKGSQIDFLKSIFTEYGLTEDSEIRTKLLLKRDNKGKLAANFINTLPFMSPNTQHVLNQHLNGAMFIPVPHIKDERTDESKEKAQMYKFLKDEIKKVKPKLKKEEIHDIGKKYASGIDDEWNPYDKGIPVSDGLYLADEKGNPVAYMNGSIKETYPEIRLRNIGNAAENKQDDGCILNGLDPNQPLLKQVIDNIDFPEDFSEHFKALNRYEKMYQQIRQDEGVYASYRYFLENRGTMVFENTKESGFKGNSKNGFGYGAYATVKEAPSGEKYSLIVLRSDQMPFDSENEWSLLHELYHRVDLHNGLCFSGTDLCRFSLMLTQKDNQNKLSEPFSTVDMGYPPSEFSKEVLAQIMERPSDKDYKDNPLISRLYKIGKILSSAKADQLPAIENRIKYALNDMPEFKELSEEYGKFMKQKEKFYKEEKDVKNNHSDEEEKTKLTELYAKQKKQKEEENNAFEPRRKELETALVQRMDKLIGQLETLQNDKNAAQIILPPKLMNLEIDGRLPEQKIVLLKDDISLSALQKHTSKLLKSNDENYPEEMLSCAFLTRELWNKTFTSRRFPNELPDFLNPTDKDFSATPFETAKKLTIFQNAIHAGCDEFDVRSQIKYGKNNLSNTEKLSSYLDEAFEFSERNKADYRDGDVSTPFSLLESKIKQSLKDEARRNLYSEAILDSLFKCLDSQKTAYSKEPFLKGIKEVLPYFSKDLQEDTMQNVLELVIKRPSPKPFDPIISPFQSNEAEQYLATLSDQDKYRGEVVLEAGQNGELLLNFENEQKKDKTNNVSLAAIATQKNVR